MYLPVHIREEIGKHIEYSPDKLHFYMTDKHFYKGFKRYKGAESLKKCLKFNKLYNWLDACAEADWFMNRNYNYITYLSILFENYNTIQCEKPPRSRYHRIIKNLPLAHALLDLNS